MACTFTTVKIPGLLLIEPQALADERGTFAETYKLSEFRQQGLPLFVQDNESVSAKDVVRGLHYQLPPHAQGKLVRCVEGAIFDVAVDIRRGSPTYGQWFGVELSAENCQMLWLPVGFAHGLQALQDDSRVLYKVTAEYHGPSDRGIAWNDPAIGIKWPDHGEPRVSAKDAAAPPLAEAENPFTADE